MDRINHTIALDLQRGIQAQTIRVMEDDTKSRAVKFVISSGGLPFEISNFSAGEVHFRRADGTSDVYTRTSAGEAAVSVSKNVVTALIDKDITQTAGRCRMSVALKDTYGRQIATFPIIVDVIALPTWGGSGTLPAEKKKYSISRSLTNCTISNTATEIEEGEPYKAVITPDAGTELTALYCTMGNTRMPVEGMSVNIAKVVGNITIVASAVGDGVFVLTNQGTGNAGKTLEVDTAGNVVPGRRLDSYIKTVNGRKPDKNGDVGVEEYDDTRVRLDVNKIRADVEALQPAATDIGRVPRATGARRVEWVRIGQPTDEQTAKAVNGWMNEHPEATTTVQDKSLTIEKMVVGTLGYVTPEMFGAIGDGIADDTNAIQSAIDTGLPVMFAARTYTVHSTLTAKNLNSFNLVYALSVQSGAKMFGHDTVIKSDCTAIYAKGVDDVTIAGIRFSKSLELIAEPIVNFDECKRILVSDCEFHNYLGDGLVLYAVQDSIVQDCHFHDFTGHGISAGKAKTHVVDCVFRNLRFRNQQHYSTSNSANPFIFAGHNCTISGIKCKNCAWGIKIQLASHNINIIDVVFVAGDNQTDNTGLKIQGEANYINHDINITNVTCQDCLLGYPVYINYTEHVNCSNIIVVNSGNVIRVSNSNCVSLVSVQLREAKGFDVRASKNVNISSVFANNREQVTNLFTVVSSDVSIYTVNASLYGSSKFLNVATDDSTVVSDGCTVDVQTENWIAISSGTNLIKVRRKGVDVDMFVNLSEGDYTDVSSPAFFYLKTGGKFIKTLPEIVVFGSSAAIPAISSIRITSGKLRIYHPASTEPRTASITVGRYIVTDS